MKTKIITILVFLLFSRYTLSAQGNSFMLSGKVIGRDSGILILDYTDKKGKWVSDTAYLKGGAFSFSGTLGGPENTTLTGDIKSRSVDDPNFTQLFLEPNKMTITLHENDVKNAVMAGSVMQGDMDLLKKQKKLNIALENEIGIQLDNTYKAEKNGGNPVVLKIKRDSLYNLARRYSAQDKIVDYAFITTHPKSYLSPYLMEYYFESRKLPLDSAEIFYSSFIPKVKTSIAGKIINDAIIARKASAIGMVAPEFTKVDINGKNIDLTSFRDKNYILLDFWASWCVPCREGIPHLKQVYRQYHSKGLDIVGLSWDSDEKAWKDAINKDSTGMWHHIFANMYLPNDNSLRNKYSIEGIPTLVLIDKSGVILDRWTGEDAETEADIDKKMAEVFSK